MPLLDAFRLKDSSHQPATWHVPWWWAFASDLRYQKKPPKDLNTVVKYISPSRRAREKLQADTKVCSSMEHLQQQALQVQRPTKNCMTITRPQSPQSKASKIVHVSDEAPKDVVQNRNEQRLCSKAKVQHDTNDPRIDETFHNLMTSYADCLPGAYTARLSERCPIHDVRQLQPTTQPEHNPHHTKDQLNNLKHNNGPYLISKAISAGLVTPPYWYDPAHVNDHDFESQDRLMCPRYMPSAQHDAIQDLTPHYCPYSPENSHKTASSDDPVQELFDLHDWLVHQPVELGLVHHDFMQTVQEQSPSTYHTCPEPPETSSCKTSDYVQKYESAQRKNKHRPSLSAVHPILYDQARYQAPEYRDNFCASPLPSIQAHLDYCEDLPTSHNHAITCCKESGCIHTHDRDDRSDSTLSALESCKRHGLINTQEHRMDRRCLVRQSCPCGIVPKYSCSVSPPVAPSSERWNCNTQTAIDLNDQRNASPHYISPIQHYQDHHHCLPRAEPSLNPFFDHEEQLQPRTSTYQTGIMHLSDLSHARRPSYTRDRPDKLR